MPEVAFIERRIFALEGFRVKLCTNDGVDLRSDRRLPSGFPAYERRAADTSTVAQWKAARFRPAFVGLDVQVLDAAGRPVHGRTLLGTVRRTYSVR